MVSRPAYQAERDLQAIRKDLDRELADAAGERLFELLRLALRAEHVKHGITRRTMDHTQKDSEGKTAIIQILFHILDLHVSNIRRCQRR